MINWVTDAFFVVSRTKLGDFISHLPPCRIWISAISDSAWASFCFQDDELVQLPCSGKCNGSMRVTPLMMRIDECVLVLLWFILSRPSNSVLSALCICIVLF